MHNFLDNANQRLKFKDKKGIAFLHKELPAKMKTTFFKHFGILEHFEARQILHISTGKNNTGRKASLLHCV